MKPYTTTPSSRVTRSAWVVRQGRAAGKCLHNLGSYDPDFALDEAQLAQKEQACHRPHRHTFTAENVARKGFQATKNQYWKIYGTAGGIILCHYVLEFMQG